jgi:hypothetical protein
MGVYYENNLVKKAVNPYGDVVITFMKKTS